MKPPTFLRLPKTLALCVCKNNSVWRCGCHLKTLQLSRESFVFLQHPAQVVKLCGFPYEVLLLFSFLTTRTSVCLHPFGCVQEEKQPVRDELNFRQSFHGSVTLRLLKYLKAAFIICPNSQTLSFFKMTATRLLCAWQTRFARALFTHNNLQPLMSKELWSGWLQAAEGHSSLLRTQLHLFIRNSSRPWKRFYFHCTGLRKPNGMGNLM